jgi:hypothetical protein
MNAGNLAGPLNDSFAETLHALSLQQTFFDVALSWSKIRMNNQNPQEI